MVTRSVGAYYFFRQPRPLSTMKVKSNTFDAPVASGSQHDLSGKAEYAHCSC